MDGLSGAVSVITVVSLALGSTRAICNIVSNFQKGSETVQQMVTSLETLSSLLQQLLANRDSYYLASDLPSLVENCATSLKALEGKLKKLISVTDTKAKKFIKNVKTTLQSKDLESMAAVVNQHVTALSMQVQIIEGQRGASHSSSLNKIEALSQRQIEISLSDSTALGRIASTTDQTNGSLKRFGATVETSNHGTCQLLEQLGNKMQDLSSISSTRASTLNDTCNVILSLLRQQNHEKAGQSLIDTNLTPPENLIAELGKDGEPSRDIQDREDNIQDTINRICRLTEEIEKTVFSVDAVTIIEDLQRFFDQLSKAEDGSSNTYKRDKRPRESEDFCSNEDEIVPHDQREVKRMKSLLTASQCVAINGKASRPWRTNIRKYESKSTYQEVQSRIGTISVRTCRRSLIATRQPENSAGSLFDDPVEFWEAFFAIVPEGARKVQIAVALRQKILREGTFVERPVLIGDLDGLIKSLSLKEARLTDRDFDGRCLLHHALHFAQSKICRFLVGKGADVNFREFFFNPDPGSRNHQIDPLRVCSYRQYSVRIRHVTQSDECYLSLLEAGADPTGHLPSLPNPAWDYEGMLEGGRAEPFRMVLDHSLAIASPDSHIEYENWLRGILLTYDWCSETILLILRRQGKNGFPLQNLSQCLHSAVRGISHPPKKDSMKDVLVLLINAGADVYERNNKGHSVSDIIYSNEPRFLDTGGGRDWEARLRRCWTEALTECGYNAQQVIRDSLRSPEAVHILPEKDTIPLTADQRAMLEGEAAIWSDMETLND